MIYVNQKQLDQVEYILEQSALGHHILFDVEDIRRVFRPGHHFKTNLPSTPKSKVISSGEHPVKETKTNAEPTEAEKHIENLILQPTILSKRTYLESLNPDMYNEVILTYFNIVENNIFEGMEFAH